MTKCHSQFVTNTTKNPTTQQKGSTNMTNKTIPIEVYVHISSTDPDHFYAFNSEMSNYGYVFLARITVDYPAPGRNDLVEQCVTSLKSRQSVLRQEADYEIKKIEENISNLRCLEHKPQAVDDIPF